MFIISDYFKSPTTNFNSTSTHIKPIPIPKFNTSKTETSSNFRNPFYFSRILDEKQKLPINSEERDLSKGTPSILSTHKLASSHFKTTKTDNELHNGSTTKTNFDSSKNSILTSLSPSAFTNVNSDNADIFLNKKKSTVQHDEIGSFQFEDF